MILVCGSKSTKNPIRLREIYICPRPRMADSASLRWNNVQFSTRNQSTADGGPHSIRRKQHLFILSMRSTKRSASTTSHHTTQQSSLSKIYPSICPVINSLSFAISYLVTFTKSKSAHGSATRSTGFKRRVARFSLSSTDEDNESASPGQKLSKCRKTGQSTLLSHQVSFAMLWIAQSSPIQLRTSKT